MERTLSDISLRIYVVSPTPGVAWAIQLGREQLIRPSESSDKTMTFDLTVRVGPPLEDGRPRFLGGAAQGPPERRFIYVNSGKRAGQAASCWDRRAKVPLTSITPGMIEKLRRVPGSRLEARIAAIGPDGGPACGTVPLLDGSWRAV